MNSFLWGREKKTKGKFRVELPPSHTHSPASGRGHETAMASLRKTSCTVKSWTPNIKPAPTEFSKQLHESMLCPSFIFGKTKDTRVYKPVSPPICTLPRGQLAPNYLFGGKIPQTIQTFPSKMLSSSNYMRTWKHFPNEKQAVLSWNLTRISPLNSTCGPFTQQLLADRAPLTCSTVWRPAR